MKNRRPLSRMKIGESFQCPTCLVYIILTASRQRSRKRRCAKCQTETNRLKKSKNPEQSREKARVAAKKYRVINKDKHRKATRAWIEKFPEKSKAQRTLRTAVDNGSLKRLNCGICGDLKSHAHHDDYSKPLEVRWLCPLHHKQHHSKSATRYFNSKEK